MPIYEYACMECESHFEELVRNAEQAVACQGVLFKEGDIVEHGEEAEEAEDAVDG